MCNIDILGMPFSIKCLCENIFVSEIVGKWPYLFQGMCHTVRGRVNAEWTLTGSKRASPLETFFVVDPSRRPPKALRPPARRPCRPTSKPEVGDVVLAKIRGYPSWPGIVVEPEQVPIEVGRERPGKRQTFYCVRFFPVGDFSWVLPKDLSKLKKHEIEAYIAEPHKKSGDLLNGYRTALDPEKWLKEKDEERAALLEEIAEEEVDELDGEEEADDDEKPTKTKKRKRESEPGTKTKAKPKKEKDAGDAGAKKKKSAEKGEKGEKGVKSKKNGVKSKAMVESEDEGERGDNAGPSKKSSPPPTKKAKRDKEEEADAEMEGDPEAAKVKDWRHKLQRAFLGKVPPKPEDMPMHDTTFSQVEEFDMSIKYLQYSKIGKVMRHIAALESDKVPRDNEYKFKDRAQALVNKWHMAVSVTGNGKTNGAHEAADGDDKAMEVDKVVDKAVDKVVDGEAVPKVLDEAVAEVKGIVENGKVETTDGAAVEESAAADVAMSED